MKETDFATKKSVNESDVIDFYDKYSEDWDQRFGSSFSTDYFIERRWRSFQDAVQSFDTKKGSAVELGVGTGVYLNRCSPLFDKITAVDGSSGMLAVTKTKITEQNISNITLIQSNVLEIDKLPEAYADCVYFFGLIEHIVDIEKFICEIKRVLKKEGVVMGVTPNGSSPWYTLRSLIRGTGKHCSTDKYYTTKELDEIFGSVGFSKVYSSCWGLVPAGLSDNLGKLLSKIEPFIENSFLRQFLGGLTFGYKRTD